MGNPALTRHGEEAIFDGRQAYDIAEKHLLINGCPSERVRPERDGTKGKVRITFKNNENSHVNEIRIREA